MSLPDIARNVRDALQSAWSNRPVRLFAVATLLTIALVIVAVRWFGDFFGEPDTLGEIVVGSPAIYTRERLVNDRLLQDAWLSAQLEPPAGIQDALAIRGESRTGVVRLGDGKEAGAPAAGTDPRSQGQTGPQPRLSSRARFLREVDYREVVRSHLIENQLDDRHDLYGNSLYRFKFEASVLPGTNTQATARIAVRLRGPAFLSARSEQGPTAGPDTKSTGSLAALGDQGAIDAWRGVYSRWIANLRSRLNETHAELKQGFHNNEFSGRDYAQLVAFLSRNLEIDPPQIPVCSALGEALRSPQRPGARLSISEHLALKRCIDAIVEKAVPKDVITVPRDFAAGTYIRDPRQLKQLERFDDASRLRRIHDVGDLYLNSFFAIRTVKLVLGVAMPERSFIQQGGQPQTDVAIPAFQKLVRLTVFKPRTAVSDDQQVFEVTEKTVFVSAIAPGKKDELARITGPGGPLAGHKPEDFIPVDLAVPNGATMRTVLLSRVDLAGLGGEAFEFTETDVQDVSSGQGILLAKAEIGLVNFMRATRRTGGAFTYGVTPRESADSVDVTLLADSQLTGQAPATKEAGSPSVALRRQAMSRALEERKGIVGFAGVSGDPLVAEFGWFIFPRQLALDGTRQGYLQAPVQHSLSALVSVPSWWSKVGLQVTTTWLGKHGQALTKTTSSEYWVDVPVDFEPLEPVLLGIEQLGPELVESRLDAVALTACRPGAIVIPGRRLWRSTKVTLGYQTADSISVLPNMKGIVAHFTTVQNQMSREEEESMQRKGTREIQRTVRVWTSQGALTLPLPAAIGIPEGTAADTECATPAERAAARAAAVKK